MKRTALTALAAASALVLAGCAGGAENGGGDAAEGDELGTLVIGIEAPWDLAYVPVSLASERMIADGYDVEIVQFEDPDVMAQALDAGDIHISGNSAGQVLAAYDAGLDVRAVLGLTNPTFVMVAASEFTTCESLDGQRLGVQGQQDFILAATRLWIEDSCPGIEPQIMEIPGSENRMNALIQDQIDASGLHVLRQRQLDAEYPGRFTTIEGFGAPENVISAWYYALAPWLEENEELMSAFATAYQEVIDEATADPSIVVDEAQRLITDVDPDLLAEVAEYWLEQGAWPAKDGLSEVVFDSTLGFYEDISPYSVEITYDDFVWNP